MKSIKLTLTITLMTLALNLVGQVVSPMQGGHYLPGVANVRDRATPPPGFFILWYNAIVSSDTYVDRNGNKFNQINLSELHPQLPDIDVKTKLNAFASIPTVYWASEKTLLGGARYMAGASLNFISADVSIFTERGGIIIDTTYTREVTGKTSGVGDMYLSPVGLSWSKEHVDFSFFYGIYLRTGRYETGAEDNIGLGFTTHQFQGFGYYYPFSEKSTAIMLGGTYELNSFIKDADVKPGDRFSLDWGISQYFSERFEATVRGGHNWQINNDSGNDVFWDASVHDRKSTLIFGAGYWILPEHIQISANYGFDYGIIQRFKNKTWLLNMTIVF